MSSPKISFIVPFCERLWCPDDGRLILLIGRLLQVINTEIILHLTGNMPKVILDALTALPHLNLIRRDITEVYSAGHARHDAAKHASGDYLFFIDADLLLHPHMMVELANRTVELARQGIQAFEMYPCIYSAKDVDCDMFEDIQSYEFAIKGLMQGKYSIAQGIALASSCLLINREWFFQLGGFDARFVGHGGEDLELIDRLTRHYPIGPRPDDYALNIKAQHPGDYQGFRRYFSYYALPHLFAGRFLVHQWHPRPLTHPYHRRRAGNDQLLEQILSRTEVERGPLKGPVLPCNDLDGELPDFREWMIRMQEKAGYPVSEYPGLLRWQEGVQRKRPLWRKLRKLYLNPRAFFADMR
ncbi:galactosyltransferase-related protein [Aeromonas veronii]|uniref:galactosyltransferase-related protein n=1 Tax=Aeromonas veronii TaxID=654 RepID=UPI003D25AB76